MDGGTYFWQDLYLLWWALLLRITLPKSPIFEDIKEQGKLERYHSFLYLLFLVYV